MFNPRTAGSPGLALPFIVMLSTACDSAPPDGAGDEAGAVEEAMDEEPGENPYWNAGDLCSLVPLQDVAAAAGGNEPMRTEAGTSSPSSCDYFFEVPDPYGPRQARASLQMLSDFRLERIGVGDAAEDVPGLGDEAWASPHTDSYLLYARRGNVVFSVNVAGVRDENRARTARAVADVVITKLPPR